MVLLLDAVASRDEPERLDVEPLDEAAPDTDWLMEVTIPLEDPETVLPDAEDAPVVDTLENPRLLEDRVAEDKGVEDAPTEFVYWLGGDTTLEELPLP